MMDEPNCRCQNEHSPCTCTDAKIRHLNDKLVEIAAERDHWRWEAQRQVSLRHEIASLLGTEDIAEAVARVKAMQGAALVMREECVRTARRHFAGDALLDALRSVEVQS